MGTGGEESDNVVVDPGSELRLLTPLEPQSRFGDKPLGFQVVCPQNGTAVLKGLRGGRLEKKRRAKTRKTGREKKKEERKRDT